jgi:hypothetical protein
MNRANRPRMSRISGSSRASKLMTRAGDGSTLSLDFTTGSLPGGLTFTRSTTATYINSSGYVTSAVINEARFDYTSGILRGLLIEGSGTNLLNWSESFATSGGTNNNWADTSITRTTGQTDPANGTTAIRFTASAGNATVISTAAIGTSAQRTFSVWLRRVTGTGNIQYTTDNGTNWTTQAITSSWVRYAFAATTASQRVGIRIVTSSDAIEMWGAQLEDGSGASSYIPTGASQGTRAADYLLSASSSGAGRSSEFSLNDLASGTSALNEYTVLWVYGRDPNSKQEYPASLFARTNADIKRVDLRDFSGTTAETQTQTRTVQSRNIGTASIAKVALAQKTSAYPISAINGTSATLTSGVIDSALGLQWVQLGNSSQVSGAFNPIWARQLKLYPTQLTAAQLQALTT